jgi:hypothetical protein
MCDPAASPTTPGRHIKSSTSIWRKLLFWFCVLAAGAILCAADHVARSLESARVRSFLNESNRRDAVNSDFRWALASPQVNLTEQSIQKQFSIFGTVTCKPVENHNWEVHIRNAANGDSMDALVGANCHRGSVTHGEMSPMHSSAWQWYTGTLGLISLVIPVLLLGGFLGFVVPRHLRRWIVAVALLVAIASTFGPNESRSPAITWWSVAPLGTLLFAALATIWPKQKRKLRKNVCRRCGYNLVKNVSGVCPECGTRINPLGDVDRLVRNLESLG